MSPSSHGTETIVGAIAASSARRSDSRAATSATSSNRAATCVEHRPHLLRPAHRAARRPASASGPDAWSSSAAALSAAARSASSAGSTRLATIAPRHICAFEQRPGEEPGLVARRGLERGHHDERRARVDEQRLDLAGAADETALHRLEQHEEVGDVLQEPRAEHPIGHLVERLRRHREQPRPVRHGQPPQQAAAEELDHPARRVEDRQRVARRWRVDDHQVEVAAGVEVVQLLHRQVLVAVHEPAGDVLVERVGEHRVADLGVGCVAHDQLVPAGLGVEHRHPQLAAHLDAGLGERRRIDARRGVAELVERRARWRGGGPDRR